MEIIIKGTTTTVIPCESYEEAYAAFIEKVGLCLRERWTGSVSLCTGDERGITVFPHQAEGYYLYETAREIYALTYQYGKYAIYRGHSCLLNWGGELRELVEGV